MQVSIDNLSGAGPVDYTGSIDATQSVSIKRVLNAPGECRFTFLPDAQGLPVPPRYARVSVTDASGLVLFTGYVVTAPAMLLSGEGISGASYAAEVTATTDEVLLDSLLSVKAGTALNQPAAATLQTLTQLVGASSLTMNTQVSPLIGRYEAKAAAKWSESAGALAYSARSAYRVVGGVTNLSPIGTVIHTLSEADGTLQLSELSAKAVKLLANDVTVCGMTEPAAYVTEVFVGDGVTKSYTLTEEPFTPIATEKLTFNDLFQGPSLNTQVWQWTDSGSRLSVTSGGVSCSGGSARDAETTLSAIHQVELGGSLVLEAGGVQVSGDGLLLGLYQGSVSQPNCFAAFQVTLAAGVTQISALVNGVTGGSSFDVVAGHTYTLRMRVYSPEMERVLQSYYYLDASGINSYGGGIVVAPGRLVMEMQDVSSGSPGIAVVLYDGTTTVLPPACTIGLLDSGALTCSVKSFTCRQTGPSWVSLATAGANPISQYIGSTAEGGSCSLASGGKLNFYTGTIPPIGSFIWVNYRTRHRSVARRSIAANVTQSGSTSLAPATQMWTGTVREPAAWSSVDCDNAAAALLESSAVASASWAGAYTGWNVEVSGDVWPGDVLAIDSPSAQVNATLVVREVQIEMGSSSPQLVRYTIRFANDWAEELALKLSPEVPADTWLPAAPAAGGSPLQNLVNLEVIGVTGSQIQVNTGLSAPAGGGFEVKRKDWTFGPGSDSDLVLRSPVSNFIIPRLAAFEQYYIRMYDGLIPPNYSQLSAAVFVDVPLGGS